MSVYTTVFSASVPIGGIAAGTLAATLGVPATLAISGGLSVAAGIGAAVWWWRTRDPETQPAPAVVAPPSTATPTPAQTTPLDGGLGGRPATR
jgi:hypothetical protein